MLRAVGNPQDGSCDSGRVRAQVSQHQFLGQKVSQLAKERRVSQITPFHVCGTLLGNTEEQYFGAEQNSFYTGVYVLFLTFSHLTRSFNLHFFLQHFPFHLNSVIIGLTFTIRSL